MDGRSRHPVEQPNDAAYPSDSAARGEAGAGGEAWLRRITLVGVGLPLLFIAAMSIGRPRVFERMWPGHGAVLVDMVTLAAVGAFALVMAATIRRGQRLLLDRNDALDAANRRLAAADRQRALDQAALLESTRWAAILDERDRIAREMHDSLAQVLGVAHLRLSALAAHPDLPPDGGARREVEALAGLCHEAYADVREAIVALRESPRADRGLLESLDAYVEKYARQSDVDAVLDNRLPADPALPPHAEVQVMRVVQEALTNVRKHSGARAAVVRLSQSPEAVVVDIEDDGVGFSPEHPAGDGGFGLRTMRERAELAGGTLTIDSTPGRGSRVSVAIPRPGPAREHEAVPA